MIYKWAILDSIAKRKMSKGRKYFSNRRMKTQANSLLIVESGQHATRSPETGPITLLGRYKKASERRRRRSCCQRKKKGCVGIMSADNRFSLAGPSDRAGWQHLLCRAAAPGEERVLHYVGQPRVLAHPASSARFAMTPMQVILSPLVVLYLFSLSFFYFLFFSSARIPCLQELSSAARGVCYWTEPFIFDDSFFICICELNNETKKTSRRTLGDGSENKKFA